MKRPVAIATQTTTSRAVRVSVAFVIMTAAVTSLIGVVAIISRLLSK